MIIIIILVITTIMLQVDYLLISSNHSWNIEL